ncbi:response regulator [Planctomycetales bacterium ZRK34]|nr:response regulator [Planctomycetales bacterium ZRK34]
MSDYRPRVLFLAGKLTNCHQVADQLRSQFDVDQFDDVDQAMAALRSGAMYHAIFADVGDFLPLERALVDQQSSLVLNTIGEGVCVVDDRGACVWANNRMQAFPPEVYDRVKQTCISARQIFAEQVSPLPVAKRPRRRSKKFGFQVGAERYFEAYVSPVIDDRGNVTQVVAVVWDASSGRRLQQKIDAIDAAGRELVRLEAEAISKLNVAERLRLLEEKIIRYTSDLLHFDNFIIRLLNKKSNKLEPVISVGLPPEALEVDLYAQPEGNGISGYVAATGRSYICHDVEKDPRYVLGLGHAKSSLTVPLRLHDKVIGVFNIESQSSGAFNEDDRQFAEIFGRYIAVALNVLDLMVVERYTFADRMAQNIVREMAAPLNDIVTETQSIIEEYIGHDDMRQRLNKVLDNVEAIRQSVKDLTQGAKTVLGTRDVEADSQSPLAGKRVLIADDEASIRNTIADVLGKFDCEVFTCKDGHEAVNLIDSQPMDLIVSDIRMPHRNGYEIFAAARRRNETIPVILMTGFGYDPNHAIVRASQEGLEAVLYKPFKVDQLLEEIYKALGITPPEPAKQPAE